MRGWKGGLERGWGRVGEGESRCLSGDGTPTRKIPMYPGMLPCLAHRGPQIMQIRISFRSRSDLVLDADNALDFSIQSRFTGVYLVL